MSEDVVYVDQPGEPVDERPTMEEFSRTVNGFELIDIKKQFGVPLRTLAQQDSIEMSYALVYIIKRREGADRTGAYNAAMALSMGEVDDLFKPEPNVPEDMDDSPSGKD